jgi:hypothetical protein
VYVAAPRLNPRCRVRTRSSCCSSDSCAAVRWRCAVWSAGKTSIALSRKRRCGNLDTQLLNSLHSDAKLLFHHLTDTTDDLKAVNPHRKSYDDTRPPKNCSTS